MSKSINVTYDLGQTVAIKLMVNSVGARKSDTIENLFVFFF